MDTLRAELKRDLDAAGLLDYRPSAVYGKAFLLLAATACLLLGFFLAPSWWLRVPFFGASVIASVALVMIGHESGHGAVSRNRLVNDFLGYFAFPFFAGLSLSYWKYKHNTQHHSYVNVDGMDPDIKIYPMAMSRSQRAKRFGLSWLVQRNQAAVFWFLALLTSLAMRADGAIFLAGSGRRLVKRRERALDIACLVGHLVAWFVVPTLVFHVPVWMTLIFYAAWSLGAGVLLAAIFLPAHMTKPIYSAYSDNFTLQLETTQNLRTNRLFSFLLIGLDHQVEHHLFQRMSHLNVKRAEPIVRAFCARHGLPYYEQGWAAAIWDSTKAIGALPNFEPSPQPVV